MGNDVINRQSNEIVTHFFRHEYARAIAYLTRKFGPENIEFIEDSLQDSMIKAMRTWGFYDIPHNPTGWIIKVASNRLIDILKRENRSNTIDESSIANNGQAQQSENNPEIFLEEELEDDQLKMIFACCQPVLSEKSQVILTLKMMCGFSTGEIAQALLLKPEAVAKAFTRAKEKLKTSDFKLLSPSPKLVNERLDVVLKIIYLLFNEGYKPAAGKQLIKQDICYEAIRLTHFLVRNKHYNIPRVNALMSLMYLQSSRFSARVSENGELIPLEDQDRLLWDRKLIEDGIFYLVEASKGNILTEYHVQASIAAYHCTAKSYRETEWNNILKLYDYQMSSNPDPITGLNRCVAYSEVHGAANALKEVEKLVKDEKLENYYLYHAIKGKLHADNGNIEKASAEWLKALDITDNIIEQNYLNKLLAEKKNRLIKKSLEIN